MSQHTLSIFVRRQGGVFVAAHGLNHKATHPTSATLAARLCASKAFDVSEELIELTPVSEHIMIAAVAGREAKRINWPALATYAAAVLVFTAACGLLVWSLGGAR